MVLVIRFTAQLWRWEAVLLLIKHGEEVFLMMLVLFINTFWSLETEKKTTNNVETCCHFAFYQSAPNQRASQFCCKCYSAFCDWMNTLGSSKVLLLYQVWVGPNLHFWSTLVQKIIYLFFFLRCSLSRTRWSISILVPAVQCQIPLSIFPTYSTQPLVLGLRYFKCLVGK